MGLNFYATNAVVKEHPEPKFVWREVIGTSMANGSDYVHVHLSCGHQVLMHMGVVNCRKSYMLLINAMSMMDAPKKIQCYLCRNSVAGEGWQPCVPSE